MENRVVSGNVFAVVAAYAQVELKIMTLKSMRRDSSEVEPNSDLRSEKSLDERRMNDLSRSYKER